MRTALCCLALLPATRAGAFEAGRDYPTPAVRPAVPAIHIAEPRAGRLTQPPSRILVFFQRFEQGLDGRSLELWIDGVEYTESLRFWVDRAWLDLPGSFVWTPGAHQVVASVQDPTGTPLQALADFEIMPAQTYIWPFAYATPNVVANLLEDYQKFSEPTPYWHHGLDLRAPDHADVRAAIGGYVAYAGSYDQNTSLQWNVTVLGDDDSIWQYSHIEMSDVQAWAVGDRVEQGDVLGQIVSWPDSVLENGARYHHLHLNVTEHATIDPVAWRNQLLDPQTPDPAPVPKPLSDGYKWHNPLAFLGQAGDMDSVTPELGGDDTSGNPPNVFFVTNDTNDAVATGDDVLPNLSGDIDVVARIGDERDMIGGLVQNPDGQPYLLGAYDVAWSVFPLDTPCLLGWKPRTSLGPFDLVPGGFDGALQDLLLLDVFQRFVHLGGATYDTEFDWDFRNLHFNVTNSFYGVLDGEKGYWNTDGATVQGPLFPDGSYRVTVFAEDYLGNELVHGTNVLVQNGLFPGNFCPNRVVALDLQGMEARPPAGPPIGFDPPAMPIAFPPIVDGSSTATLASSEWAPWYFDDPAGGQRIAVGVLAGDPVEVEYVPYLGDVILEVPAEVQVLPWPAGAPPPEFDPAAPSTQPVDLRLSTRLARRPDDAQALLGDPAAEGEADFSLVLAEQIDVTGASWLLLAGDTDRSTFTVPEPGVSGLYLGLALLSLLRLRRREPTPWGRPPQPGSGFGGSGSSTSAAWSSPSRSKSSVSKRTWASWSAERAASAASAPVGARAAPVAPAGPARPSSC